jgi:drug/metabolite transporter (DMT)-like permease
MTRQRRLSIVYALVAAMLFGSSAPVSKMLLIEIEPIALASLLYLGSGLGLLLLSGIGVVTRNNRKEYEASLQRVDLPLLGGMILFGGVLAPVTLMVSLTYTTAATAALLLNFEAVATSVIAVLWYREAIGRRIWVALGFITLSCVILTLHTNGSLGFSVGALGILLTTIFWAMDNNISRNISSRDPIPAVMIKGFGAGMISLAIAILLGETLPDPGTCLIAMAIGFLSYGGITSVLFLMALRGIGTSRTGSFLAVSPFFGVIISFLLFTEPLDILFYISFPVMVLGAYLIVTEKHSHMHSHPALAHEHRHRHDENHHEHEHTDDMPTLSSSGEHSHLHLHEEIIHEHPHTPDIHHQHMHERKSGILYRLHTKIQHILK